MTVHKLLCIAMRVGMRRRPLHVSALDTALAGALALVTTGASGQDAATQAVRQTVLIEPRLTVSQTFTDNVNLASAAKQSEQITQLSPGIRLTGESARLKAYLDYVLSGIAYGQGTSPGRSQNALTAFGTVEALEQRVYLDFSANISQQAISAFGTQSSADASVNANKTEVASYRLSPYVRGSLAGAARYEARLTRTVTQGDSSAASGVATSDVLLKLNGERVFGNLGWLASASRQGVDYSLGRPTEADLLELGLSYAVTPQFNVFANAGREFSNYTSLDKQTFETTGFGAKWSPSDRTHLSAAQARRSFGESHSVSVEHQTALTVWKYTRSQDVSSAPSQAGLLLNSANPGAPVGASFLSSAVALQQRQDVSVTLQGVRDTVTLTGAASENRRLDTLSSALDDLSTAPVRQLGLSVDYSHRLTPVQSLGLLLSQQKTLSVAGLPDATLHFLNIYWTGKLGRKASATVGARRSVYSGASSYDESALTLQLTLQF